MKADFSRLIFDSKNHYTGVLHQQGRVWLDSDWNEEVLERLNLLRQETVDIVGSCGVPSPGTAFQITRNFDPNSAPDDFLISGGAGSLGHYYAGGLLAELDQPVSYLTQPDFPNPPRIPMPAAGGEAQAIVYLEVWQRLITYLQDASIREVALGGPDTTARVKTVAQVKVQNIANPDARVTCANAATFLPGPSLALLTTLQPPVLQPEDECRVPDPGNYTGRENRLYRVEIHDGGDVAGLGSSNLSSIKLASDAPAGTVTLTLAAGLSAAQAGALVHSGVARLADDDGQSETVQVAAASDNTVTLGRGLIGSFRTARNAVLTGGVARFKWSRDNASFAVGVRAIASDRLTLSVASLGRDQATALRAGDLVEITDDASDLGPGRGFLTYLAADPDPDALTVALADRLPGSFQVPGDLQSPLSVGADHHLLLRRWDGLGWTSAGFDPAGTPDMDLGQGVHIQFGGSASQPGDYWQFTARSADGSVEALEDAPPMGIVRYRCPLAIVRWRQEPFFNLDLINSFLGNPVLQFTPDQIKVFVQILQGTGHQLFGGDEIVALAAQIPAAPAQMALLAELLSRLGDRASDRRLAMTVVDDCRQPFLPLTGLAADPGLHVVGVIVRTTTPDGRSNVVALRNDSAVTGDQIAAGIFVELDSDVDPASVRRPTCFVSIEIPFAPAGNVIGGAAAAANIAFQVLNLAADVSVDGNVITWKPSQQVVQALSGLAAPAGTDKGYLMRLTLKGNAIWAKSDPTSHLDGQAFGLQVPGATNIDLQFPSGDGKRGGDFEMWFWLVPTAHRVLGILANIKSGIFANPATRPVLSLSIDRQALVNALPAGTLPANYQVDPTKQDLNTSRALVTQFNLRQRPWLGFVQQKYGAMANLLRQFLSANDVNVNLQVLGDAEMIKALQTAVAAGQQLPDFIAADDTLFAQIVAAAPGFFDAAQVVVI